MVKIYKCRFCGRIVEVVSDKPECRYGSMSSYITVNSGEVKSHQCNKLITGVMELVAVRE